MIADETRGFDRVAGGYNGPLYAEISPKTFPVLVREGSRLSQLRFRHGDAALDAEALRALHARERLVDRTEAVMGDGVAVSIDLSGGAGCMAVRGADGIVGYRAKRHTAVIEVERRAAYEVADFWEPIAARADRSLILDPDEFYILASTEAVQVPPDYAAEMVPFDPLVGEFRVHYAGFFDPGFGYAGAGGLGSRAVLEVRSREVPFILEHGQIVGRLVYEKMLARPDQLYGARHRLELSGAGPQIVEALPRLSVANLFCDAIGCGRRELLFGDHYSAEIVVFRPQRFFCGIGSRTAFLRMRMTTQRGEAKRMRGHSFAALTCLPSLPLGGVASRSPRSPAIDRPGGDYASAPVPNGDPAVCASRCERDKNLPAWSFSYPSASGAPAMCWLKREVVPRTRSSCCVSGVRGAGVIEPQARRHRIFDRSRLAAITGLSKPRPIQRGKACADACQAETRCRAWTYRRPGYGVSRAALLSEGRHQAAAPSAVLHFRRGAVRCQD